MRKDYPDEFKLKTILHTLKKDREVTSIVCRKVSAILYPAYIMEFTHKGQVLFCGKARLGKINFTDTETIVENAREDIERAIDEYERRRGTTFTPESPPSEADIDFLCVLLKRGMESKNISPSPEAGGQGSTSDLGTDERVKKLNRYVEKVILDTIEKIKEEKGMVGFEELVERLMLPLKTGIPDSK